MLPEAAQFAASTASGAVFGGLIVRYLVNKWLKDREEFERETLIALTDLRKADSASEKAVLLALNTAREDGLERLHDLKEHADKQDLTIRDRVHDLAGIVHGNVASISAVKEQVGTVSADMRHLTDELHQLTISLTELTARLPSKG